jgi:hypothetical protein
MIGLSPRGVLEALLVFPIMFVIALILDILNIILSLTVIGGIILALVGFLTVGLWIILRGGGRQKENQPTSEGGEAAAKEGAETAEKEGAEVAAKEGAEVAGKEGVQTAEKTAVKEGVQTAEKVAVKTAEKSALRVGLRMGAVTLLKAIPGIGIISSIVFGWTVMVIGELISDFKNFSLERGD